MKFIDMHADSLSLAYMNKNDDLYETQGMLDIRRMKEAGQLTQFFAIFMPPPSPPGSPHPWDTANDEEYIDYCIDAFANTVYRHPEAIAPALCHGDIARNEAEGKASGLLTFEDSRAVNGSMDRLASYFDRGIRLFTLTWNQPNCFGYPHSTDPASSALPLTDFGREAIGYMNDLGAIIDVSHLSDGGFWDVARISKKPFVASHSNLRSISPHSRNLTEEMMKALADAGGVAGINFAPAFLEADISSVDSKVDAMIAHIRRMVDVGGIGSIALGSDLDGISGNLEVGQPTSMHLIFERLEKEGFSANDIEKIAFGNALRVIADVLG